MKVLGFGEVLWDMYPDNKYLGGGPFNFGVHFTRLGGKLFLVSAVGDDDLGREIRKISEEYGLKTDFLTVSDKITGRCVVTLDKNAIPHFDLLDNIAYDDINYSDKMKESDYDLLYFGTLSLRHEHNRQSIERIIKECKVGKVFVDVNLRVPFYNEETVKFAVSNANILKISDEELPKTLEMLSLNNETDIVNAAKLIAEHYKKLDMIVITQGEKGATSYRTSDGQICRCDSVKVKAVSTVGAGDSFSAAFMYNYLDGKDTLTCLKEAAKLAAKVVSQFAAV